METGFARGVKETGLGCCFTLYNGPNYKKLGYQAKFQKEFDHLEPIYGVKKQHEKLNDLRAHLMNAVIELRRDPDRLQIFADQGALKCTFAAGFLMSFHISQISF